MDGIGLQVISALRQMIDAVGWVVIPAEILLLMLVRRRLLQPEVLVNLTCGAMIFLLFRVWRLGFGFHLLMLVHGYAIFQFHDAVADMVWLAAHVLVGDLCFYLFHRLAHTRIFFCWITQCIIHQQN